MAANALGSVYWGSYPAIDNNKYYSGGSYVLPASQSWSIWGIVRFQHLLLGTDQTNSSGSSITIWGNNSIGNVGGNDTYIGLNPANFGTPADALKIVCRMAVAGVAAHSSGTTMKSASVLVSKNKSYVIALRYDAVGGNIELVLCEQGGSATVIATSAANATFVGSARTISGTKRVGYSNWANEVQQWGCAAQLLSNSDIASIAAGADPESIVTTVGNRLSLYNFDSPAATITPKWGSGNLTQNGTWTNAPSPSPLIPASGGAYLTCNEPQSFQSFGLVPGTHATTVTLTGKYSGFTPTNLQAKIIKSDGTTAQALTNLGNQVIGSGNWSGSISIPEGSRYTLSIQADNGTVWTGSHPFHVCPVQLTMGQSPEVRMALSGKGLATLNNVGSGYIMVGDEIVVMSNANCGFGYIEVLNQLSLSTTVPLVILPAAITGTSSTQWAAKTAGLWDIAMAMALASNARAFYVTWLNSAADSSIITSTIISNHGTIYTNLGTDLPAGSAYCYSIDKPNRDTGNNNTHRVAQAQRTFCLTHASYNVTVFIGAQFCDTQMDAEGTFTVGTWTTGATNDTITIPIAPENEQFAATTNGTILVNGNSYAVNAGQFNTTTGVATIVGHFTGTPSGLAVYWANTPHQVSTAAGNGRMGRRRGQYFARRWGWAAKGSIGPVIQTVTYPAGGYAGALTVNVAQNAGTSLQTPNSGSGATNVAGFEVSEDGFSTFKTITVAITGANVMTITVISAVTTPANLVVRYNFVGGYPFAANQWQSLKDLPYDNSGISDQGGAPVEPTYDSISVTQAAAAVGGYPVGMGFGNILGI